jgi:hypothetical protein
MKNWMMIVGAAGLLCSCQTWDSVKQDTSSYVVEPVKSGSAKVGESVVAGAAATSSASKNLAQKSALLARLPANWTSTVISETQLKQKMAVADKATWYYMGTRGAYHYVARDFADTDRKIYRVKMDRYFIQKQFKLSVKKADWRPLPRDGQPVHLTK